MVKTLPSNTGKWVQFLLGELRSHYQKPEWKQQKQYFNKFNKDIKNGSHQKNL